MADDQADKNHSEAGAEAASDRRPANIAADEVGEPADPTDSSRPQRASADLADVDIEDLLARVPDRSRRLSVQGPQAAR